MKLITDIQANDIDFIISILAKNFDIKDIKTHFENTFNSYAYEINNQFIVRFPRHEKGAEKLIKESKILKILDSRITLQIPITKVCENEYFYSFHNKVNGKNINQNDLNNLSYDKKDKFCYDIANFIYELNSATDEIIAEINMPFWDKMTKQPAFKTIVNFVLQSDKFSLNEKDFINNFFSTFSLDNDKKIISFSHFDIMSKNTAFDFDSKILNGIYDFGDCAIGDVYHDFSQIALDYNYDTIKHIVNHYEELSKIKLDIQKIENYSLFSWLGFCCRHQTDYGFLGVKRKIAEMLL